MENMYNQTIQNALLNTFYKYNNNFMYSDEELSKATIQVQKFFDRINGMVIYENGITRKLNNLELFIAVYEFVANRVYTEQTTSHDLIGTLITNRGVCQGYCQLMSFLCKVFDVPFLYKTCTTYNENGTEIGSHGNFEVIVQDKNGLKHCLHCDPTIDSPKNESDILGFNALLLQDNDINKYYHKQIPAGGDISSFYYNFSSKQKFEQYISNLTKVDEDLLMMFGKTKEEKIHENINRFKNDFIQLNKFFNMNINFDGLNDSQLIAAYKTMYEYYISMSQPIDPEQLKQAIKNVKTAEIMYETHISYQQALNQSHKIFKQRMEKSIDLQKKNWENTDGLSFMFMEIKNEKIFDSEIK